MSRLWAVRPRAVPLVPTAALYPREDVNALRARLDIPDRSNLTAVATPTVLILLGPAAELPWTPNVRYFGRDQAAPSLLVSTAVAPTAPMDLLEKAVARAAKGPGPWLVDDVAQTVIAVAAARKLSLGKLDEWLERNEAAQ
jgi:hypothetical protein